MDNKNADLCLLRMEKQIPLISSKLAVAVDLLADVQWDLGELYISVDDPVEPEENRLLAEEVLAANPDCKKGELKLPGLSTEVNKNQASGIGWDIQLLPFVQGLEGFYMAYFTRLST